ncbi:MAG: T9SS type A sorting domain-containing protein [Candidatus Cloacimonetes bacterium]|nr:T9SS type A sorting domain-containing protein [Candidatus Cloacimonadota bacterium]
MKMLLAMLVMATMMVGLTAEQVVVNADRFEVNVWQDGPDRTEIDYRFGSFERFPVNIEGQDFFALNLPGESRTYRRGLPELPKITRALSIGSDAFMEVRFIDGQYTDMQMNVVPSKGEIFRNINPATVPYTFDRQYDENAFWPAVNGDRSAPYIMRDIRGIAVHAYPFQYNPVTGTLRVWHHMRLEVVRTGVDTQNVKERPVVARNRYFNDIYSRRFVNLETTRYDSLSEAGSILVVTDPSFLEAMIPWVEWKVQKGFDVEMVDVTTLGTTATDIKNYVQAQYDDPQINLTFLQLVGDAAQIPTFTSGNGGSDPSYSLLEGTDTYPDIFVGRFSATTVTHVNTQVERSIHYERDIDDVDAEWLHKGMGVASSQGAGMGHYGEADHVHMGYIRDDLLAYTYTDVDEIYANNGGNSSMITAALNEGRTIVNYCGHGTNTSWSTTGFNNTNVNSLTNDNKLPHIVSVACVNGNFTNITCFAEAWLRATNDTTGLPTGAIANYSSSINQSWAPPMYAQDEIVDLLVGDFKNTTGGLFYNGSCYMMDVQGAQGVSMFLTWHIFGDCSLQVRSDVPTPFALNNMSTLFIGLDTYAVDAGVENALVCLSYQGVTLGSGYTGDDGTVELALDNIPTQPCDLTLTVTGYNKITHEGIVQLLPNEGAYLIFDDPVYNDGNNGIPEYGENLTISLSLENVGAEPAYNAQAIITCESEYLLLIDSVEDIGTIEAESTRDLTDAFEIALAGNIPDLLELNLNFLLTAENAQGEPYEWSQTLSLTAHAPHLNIQAYHIFDSSGNNNGLLDPGETVAIEVPVENIGSCDSPEAVALLVCNNPYVTIQNGEVIIGVIEVDDIAEPTFVVSLSEDVSAGEILPIGFGVYAGEYALQTTIIQGLPAQIETFENGLDIMGWGFSGDANWTLNDEDVYEGDWSLRSGAIGANEETSAEFDYNVTVTGDMVFYRKISSEVNHDYLRLYIDDAQVGQWSGLSQWLPVTIQLNETGVHTFRWTYEKDSSVDSGADCAWIDFISFPGEDPQPVPIIALSTQSIDFSDTTVGETGTADITLYNYGNLVLTGNIDTPDGFTIDMPGEQLRPGDDRRAPNRETYPFDLLPLETMTMTLIFEPTENIDYSGEVLFTSNDPYAPELGVEVIAELTDNDDNDITPFVTELGRNYPNPFNPETTVAFSLAEPGAAELVVYNIRGRRVKTLLRGELEAGNHTVVWSGDTDSGKPAASGIYFLSMHAGRYTATKKMILLK